MKSKESVSYLKDLRKQNKISQKQLASYSKYSEGYISQIESSKKKPSADFLIKIAKYLKVNEITLLKNAGLISGEAVKDKIKLYSNFVHIGDLSEFDKTTIRRIVDTFLKAPKK